MATQQEIEDNMTGPRRIRGDQGEVDNRSMDEWIKYWNWKNGAGSGISRHTILRNSIVQGTKYGPCDR